jgi:hypothetical protein
VNAAFPRLVAAGCTTARSTTGAHHGFDFHAPSIETARQRADEAGVSAQTSFEVADSKGYSGTFALICLVDCLHERLLSRQLGRSASGNQFT